MPVNSNHFIQKNLNSFLYYENIQINLEFKTLDSRGMYYMYYAILLGIF